MGVLPPIVFNLCLVLVPDPPSNVSLVLYADNCTAFVSGLNINDISGNITGYPTSLVKFFRNRKF